MYCLPRRINYYFLYKAILDLNEMHLVLENETNIGTSALDTLNDFIFLMVNCFSGVQDGLA